MRRQLSISLLLIGTCFFLFEGKQANAKTFYVAANGNNANPGTQAKPYKDWQKLSEVLQAGDTAFIRGGTYIGTPKSSPVYCHFLNLKGNIKDSIYILAYPGEFPVLDLSGNEVQYPNPTAIILENCYFVHIAGLRITGLKQISSGNGISRGLELRNSSNNLLENLEIDHLGGYGFIIGENSNHNLFKNCDAHHLSDPFTRGGAWGNANGFQCTGGTRATGNTFYGCRAWWISDDGFDLYGVDGEFSFINCWSFWNGYKPGTFTAAGDGVGFKLGPQSKNYQYSNTLNRTLRFCIAAGNRGAGYDQNNGDFRYAFLNNISQSNGSYGFMFDYVHPARKQQFSGNHSISDKFPKRGTETDGLNNSWDAGFKEKLIPIDIHSLRAKRQSNGDLPPVKFKPANNSLK